MGRRICLKNLVVGELLAEDYPSAYGVKPLTGCGDWNER
jgi:hypothetical protein